MNPILTRQTQICVPLVIFNLYSCLRSILFLLNVLINVQFAVMSQFKYIRTKINVSGVQIWILPVKVGLNGYSNPEF